MLMYMYDDAGIEELERRVRYVNNLGGNAEVVFSGKTEYIRVGGNVVRLREAGAHGGFRIPDWSLVAELTPAPNGNLIRSTSDDFDYADLPRSITHAQDCICEHCNVLRMRNKFGILRNRTTGEYKMVGSSCLRQFTGGLSASAMAAAVALYVAVEHPVPISPTFNMYSNPMIMFMKILRLVHKNRRDSWYYKVNITLGELRAFYHEALETVTANDRVSAVDRSFMDWILDDVGKLSRESRRVMSDVLMQPWTCVRDWNDMRMFHRIKWYLRHMDSDKDIVQNFAIRDDLWDMDSPVNENHYYPGWVADIGDVIDTQAVPIGTVEHRLDGDVLLRGKLKQAIFGGSVLMPCYDTPKGIIAVPKLDMSGNTDRSVNVRGRVVDNRRATNGAPYSVLGHNTIINYSKSEWNQRVRNVENERQETRFQM